MKLEEEELKFSELFFLLRHFACRFRYSTFNSLANAAESDKRDLMKELETMKQLKPHPYVIKLLGCVIESGMLWLWRLYFAIRIFFTIKSVRLSSR